MVLGLDTDFHNQKVLFPTVAVCPNIPYDSNLVNITAYQSLTVYDVDYEDYVPILKTLPKLSYETIAETYNVILNMTGTKHIDGKDLRELAFKVGIKCEELFFKKCRYRDEEVNCCEKFFPIFTEHGLCFAFNTRYYGTPAEE